MGFHLERSENLLHGTDQTRKFFWIQVSKAMIEVCPGGTKAVGRYGDRLGKKTDGRCAYNYKAFQRQ